MSENFVVMSMPEQRRLVEESHSEEYLHKEAWAVVLRQIEHAEANPIGSLYDDLVAMVFAFHCLEGYLNFVGEKIAPDLWADEKAQFNGSGVDGKLIAICERCGISKPDKGKRPYATLSVLKKLRDRMAHPKTRRVSKKIEFWQHKPLPLFAEPYLATLLSHQKAIRARDDLKEIADSIHKAATSKFPRAGLGYDPLGGTTRMRSFSIRVATPL